MTHRFRAHEAKQKGSITAELAVVLPAVVAVLALMLTAILIAARQVEVEGAAAGYARAEARGASEAAQIVLGQLHNAEVTTTSTGGALCALVRMRVQFGPAALTLSATSCAPESVPGGAEESAL